MNFDVSSCTKFQIFRGSAPDPAPDSLAGWEGLVVPFPRTPSPLSALRASGFFFSLYLSIRGLQKGPGKFLMGVLETSRIFLSVKKWKPLLVTDTAVNTSCRKLLGKEL